MFKKITSGLFIIILLTEIACRLSDYTIANNFLNIILKLYLTIFIIAAVILFFSKLPKPIALGLVIVLILSLIIFLVIALPSLILGTSGHSVVSEKWSGNNFRVENVTGQDWAGPNYDNYILYKTKFAGLLKKEISLIPTSLQTDTCLIKFIQYSKVDSTIYYFDNCKKELRVMESK